jgi:Orsellinic acid/F9775 biosynthesis cluster protein D
VCHALAWQPYRAVWLGLQLPALLRTPYLDSLGLVVDPSLRVLCCEFHQVAMEASNAVSHIREQHEDKKTKVDVDRVTKDLASLGGVDALPVIEATGTPRRPFAGLRIQTGFRCTLCPKVLGTLQSIRYHHKTDHTPGEPYPSDWPACHIQQLNVFSHRTYFEVSRPRQTDPTPFDTILSSLEVDMGRALASDVSRPNARAVSPWLLRTQWHVHVEGHDTQELRRLVANPKDVEFPGLRRLLLAYLRAATSKIEGTDELVLQRLNSPLPDTEWVVVVFAASETARVAHWPIFNVRGISNTPFGKHQQENTLHNYVLPALGLVAMLIRPKGKYTIPLPAVVEEAIADFESARLESDEDKTIDRLHGLFMALWTHRLEIVR